MDVLEIRRLITFLDHRILPCPDIRHGDLIHLLFSEIGDELVRQDIFLLDDRVFAQTMPHVFHIQRCKIRKLHIQTSILLQKK